MIAERHPSEEEHEVSSLASARNRQRGRHDPFEDEPGDVIAHFLIEAGHFKAPSVAAQYVIRMLAPDPEESVAVTEQAVRDRLRGLVYEHQRSDDSWEDRDDIAGIIYDQLLRTRSQDEEMRYQREAWRRLLPLRGVDIKPDIAGEGDPNHDRWMRLLHKLGDTALE